MLERVITRARVCGITSSLCGQAATLILALSKPIIILKAGHTQAATQGVIAYESFSWQVRSSRNGLPPHWRPASEYHRRSILYG